MSNAREIEVNLRIPNAKFSVKDESGYPIDHAYVRFIKRTSLPSLPPVGTEIDLSAGVDASFKGTVVQTQWHDDKAMFVVYCQYSKKSLSQPDYQAIIDDPAWEMKPLL